MKRIKKHKIKSEKPETSTSHGRQQEDYDLTYFIHDRVELMHQVFSVLKSKDLKAMAPECVRHISIDDLQELCTEELLGISSKRLCAILDGAEPPSDTESSSASPSPERLETISLDSISSDDEILSQASSKKHKKKHRRRDSKKSKKSAEAPEEEEEADAEKSRAARAGLTVLELLELQARARAIRAQLQQEQAANASRPAEMVSEGATHSTDQDDVEIKEEPAEVVEISSDEEKPDLRKLIEKSTSNKETEKTNESTKTVTKRNNDLIITVPKSKATRKIKLNRSKSSITATKPSDNKNIENVTIQADKPTDRDHRLTDKDMTPENAEDNKLIEVQDKPREKKKRHKKKSKKNVEKDGSDHDEITLQLSDSEKMDLLEGLDRKNLDQVTSSSSEDSEDSSSDSETHDSDVEDEKNNEEAVTRKTECEKQIIDVADKSAYDNNASVSESSNANEDQNKSITNTIISQDNLEQVRQEVGNEPEKEIESLDGTNDVHKEKETAEDLTEEVEVVSKIKETKECVETDVLEVTSVEEIPVINDEEPSTEVVHNEECASKADDNMQEESNTKESESKRESNTDNESRQDKKMSDGELSDRASSEVEAFDLHPEIVCISDDDFDKKAHKKKKKKEKKNKKEKKAKRTKQDFPERGDQNFYKETTNEPVFTEVASNTNEDNANAPSLDIDVLELSDDSSCYEVEGTVLSKEPTAEEIEALSAKIDEIDREDIITEEEIRQHEMLEEQKRQIDENLENVSWKDRYLDSRKVKRVLSTSNILNALRKKNRELKKKIEEAKKQDVIRLEKEEIPQSENVSVQEGSIDHFHTLQGSSKYVDPVAEPNTEKEVTEGTVTEVDKNKEGHKQDEEKEVTKEMKKDAKQLLKMYKRLLKYNDVNKQKDPNKKKKKKSKKKKDKSNEESIVVS